MANNEKLPGRIGKAFEIGGVECQAGESPCSIDMCSKVPALGRITQILQTEEAVCSLDGFR